MLPPEPVAEKPDPDFAPPDFTADQSAAAAALKATLATGGYSVTLIDGVTGSGKTEVYFEAVADTIRRGRQSLILMPEIALTAQFLDRFAARFGVRPAEWHSELSPRKRARTWRAVADGDVSVVVGARSALFLPYADLGLVVVDEEHDPAYKQEDGVRYHARDMAVVRGHIAHIPVVLSSATPSLETEVNARRGRYQRLTLPERFGGQRMPAVEAIDLRHERPPPGRFIAPSLAGAVENRARARRAGAVFPQPPRGWIRNQSSAAVADEDCGPAGRTAGYHLGLAPAVRRPGRDRPRRGRGRPPRSRARPGEPRPDPQVAGPTSGL